MSKNTFLIAAAVCTFSLCASQLSERHGDALPVVGKSHDKLSLVRKILARKDEIYGFALQTNLSSDPMEITQALEALDQQASEFMAAIAQAKGYLYDVGFLDAAHENYHILCAYRSKARKILEDQALQVFAPKMVFRALCGLENVGLFAELLDWSMKPPHDDDSDLALAIQLSLEDLSNAEAPQLMEVEHVHAPIQPISYGWTLIKTDD